MGAAHIQSATETLPVIWALVTYLVPDGIALGLVVAVVLRRRRRRKREEGE